jgi:hypothetical protein
MRATSPRCCRRQAVGIPAAARSNVARRLRQAREELEEGRVSVGGACVSGQGQGVSANSAVVLGVSL